jgi:hypothetical protein
MQGVGGKEGSGGKVGSNDQSLYEHINKGNKNK